MTSEPACEFWRREKCLAATAVLTPGCSFSIPVTILIELYHVHVHVLVCLTTLLAMSDCIASISNTNMNNESESLWTGVVLAWFTVLYWRLPVGTEENHDNAQYSRCLDLDSKPAAS